MFIFHKQLLSADTPEGRSGDASAPGPRSPPAVPSSLTGVPAVSFVAVTDRRSRPGEGFAARDGVRGEQLKQKGGHKS